MFDLSLEMLRVVEEAAIASARTMGMGDAKAADHAAVESMRRSMDTVLMDGTIVIGEGEPDEAPMLYIGEKVGARDGAATPPAVDIAVDPLEGTNLCATGGAGAITVLAASEGGGLLHAPDCYMEKSWSARPPKQRWNWTRRLSNNLKAIARRLQRCGRSGGGARPPAACEADRRPSRGGRAHSSDFRWRPFSGHRGGGGRDGRACRDGVGRRTRGRADRGGAGLSERRDSGAPGGERRSAKREMQAMGSRDANKVYTTRELAPGRQLVFAACGVTGGNLLQGVRFTADGVHTQAVVMTLSPARVRFLNTTHLENRPDVKVRFR